jgi:hypothetical protein
MAPPQSDGTVESSHMATWIDTEERAVAHGYYREHLFMVCREKADIRARISVCAERAGYQFGKIFEEKVESVPSAFHDLVQALVNDKAAAVVVPNLGHFAVLGHPIAIRDGLQAALQVPVLVSDPSP